MRGGSGERDPDLAGGHRETVGGLCPGVSGWILPQEPAKQSSPPARQSWQRKAMASSWMESFWLEAHWTRPFHLTLAFCLALGLLQAIKLYLQRQRLLRDLRLFPSPPTHWLYGHQKLFKDGKMENLEKIVEKYPCAFPRWVGPFAVFFYIYDPDYAKTFLSRTDPKSRFLYRFIIPTVGKGLVNLDGPKWSQHRRLLTPGFHFNTLKSFVEVMVQSVNIMLDKWEKICGSQDALLDVYEHIDLMTLDVLMKCIFSWETNCQTDSSHDYYVKATSEGSNILIQRVYNYFYHCDLIFKLSPLGHRLREINKILHQHTEPDILECEVKWTLGGITMNKTSEGDGIPVELFQILEDDIVKVLHSICQQIWKTQQWPQDSKRSVFIPIPKKSNAQECLNYHTIALISHAGKVMLKIIQARLQQYVNCELPDVQVGFRKGRGTRDQIANICWIMEKVREFQKNIYFCFIDYAKSFDCVDHNKLWKILKEMGIPDHLTCLLRNLYAGQEATVRSGHGTTDWFQIGKVVRQGCMLSPCLFNFYAEYIMRNTGLEEAQAGIKIARRNINNLRYADDTTLMAENEEELKSLLMKVKEESEKVGLKLNIQKTKIMAPSPIPSWEIDGETVETVSDFIFLGSQITADGACSHEIKRCLLLGRKVMTNLDSIFKSRDITLPTKVCLVKAMVFPVVMYGCENWTVKKAQRQRIDAFELWCWRRLLRVPWTARRSSQSILKEISPGCSLEGLMLKLKLQYFGHLM